MISGTAALGEGGGTRYINHTGPYQIELRPVFWFVFWFDGMQQLPYCQ